MATPITPARPPYAPPAQITVQPLQVGFGSADQARKELVFVLDTETGDFRAEKWDRSRYATNPNNPPAYYPTRDLWFIGDSDGRGGSEWWNRDPRRLAWYPKQWCNYVTDGAAFAEVLDLMGHWAKVLVDALEPLPDGGYDWTLPATAAYERIGYLANYGRKPLTEGIPADDPWHGDGTGALPARHHDGAVDFGEIVAADPNWADPRWAAMTDAQLDQVAEAVHDPWGKDDRAEWTSTAGPALKATIRFHRDRLRGDQARPLAEQNRGLSLHPVGVRAGLRRWRAALLASSTGMPAVNAAEHLDGQLPAKLVATTGDTELAELARLVAVEAAHTDSVALVGVLDYLARARGEMRRQLREELAGIVAERRGVADHLAQLTARRASLLAAVAAFREEPEWPDDDAAEPNYAELGRLAGMTRQAALEQLRPLFAGDDADAEAEARTEARQLIVRTVRDSAYGKAYASDLIAAVSKVGLRLRRPIVEALLAELVNQRILMMTNEGVPRYQVSPPGTLKAGDA